jgi:hypothetical protein
MARILNSQTVTLERIVFQFSSTDFIQQITTLLWFEYWGNLGSNSGIAETDKTKFMISSIMEEAISSSQMEGKILLEKAKEMISKRVEA